VERLLNVIMTIGSRRRIDRAKLFSVIPDYAEATSEQAAERMFERDKAAILELGLPLVTERDVLDENTVHYRIQASPSTAVLDLTTEEYTTNQVCAERSPMRQYTTVGCAVSKPSSSW
jgi:predicted DNA-binding transcriptional regulator YafY